MAFCVQCGAKVEDNVKYCSQCGAEIPVQEQDTRKESTYGQSEQDYEYDQHHNTYNAEEYFDNKEVQENKLMGVLSYLGFLVLIPIFAGNKDSEYVKFHSNQGLVLMIVSIISDLFSGERLWGIGSFFDFGNMWFSWIFGLCSIACFIFSIWGIVNACKGKKRELPIIGQIKILK